MAANPKAAKPKRSQAPGVFDNSVRAFLYLCLFFYSGILLTAIYYHGWLSIPELIAGIVSILIAEGALSYLWVKQDRQLREMLLAVNETNNALNQTMKTIDEINHDLLAELKKRRESLTETGNTSWQPLEEAKDTS
jgi:hypothetical protein